MSGSDGAGVGGRGERMSKKPSANIIMHPPPNDTGYPPLSEEDKLHARAAIRRHQMRVDAEIAHREDCVWVAARALKEGS